MNVLFNALEIFVQKKILWLTLNKNTWKREKPEAKNLCRKVPLKRLLSMKERREKKFLTEVW